MITDFKSCFLFVASQLDNPPWGTFTAYGPPVSRLTNVADVNLSLAGFLNPFTGSRELQLTNLRS